MSNSADPNPYHRAAGTLSTYTGVRLSVCLNALECTGGDYSRALELLQNPPTPQAAALRLAQLENEVAELRRIVEKLQSRDNGDWHD